MAKKNGKGAGSQCYKTPGGIITPVEGFSRDAGLGTPPAPGRYGAPTTGSIPTGGDRGSNKGPMNSYFKKGGK